MGQRLRRSAVALLAAGTAGAVLTGAGYAETARVGRTVSPFQQGTLNVTAKALQGIEFPTTVRTLIAKAQPDACYVPGSFTDQSGPPCAAGAQPKVNQGYAWSIVATGNDVWWGTIANPLCQVYGAFLGITTPVETPSYVCEFSGGNPLGDTRPPQVWLYQSVGGAVTNETPVDPLVATTAGFRAAGALNGVVLFAGPRLSSGGGLNMFAFDANTHAFIASSTVGGALTPPQAADYTVYTDIRAMLVVEGQLYLGIKYEIRNGLTGLATARGGKVLRWTGDSVNPFSFVEVGDLDTEAAYLAYHEGRVFASTWPVRDPVPPFTTHLAGVWMSPDLGADKILGTGDDSGSWSKVWQVDAFEPDPLVAATDACGAIASFDGYLYWGTMHVPFLATQVHLQAYSAYYSTLDDTTTPTAAQALLAAMIGTYRTTTIFRGSNFTTTPQFDLVYGNPIEPVATYNSGPPPTLSWNMTAPNNMGGSLGMWGIAGFGNLFNNYLWSAQVNNGRLWMGTMDWSYLIWDGVNALIQALAAQGVTIDLSQLPQVVQDFIACQTQGDHPTVTGGDLYYFPGSDRPAFPESISGVGNYTSYGIRSMTSAPSGLFLGMANPMNLLTDLTDDVPEGGWEVIRLVDKPMNTPTGTNVTVTLDDGSTVTYCGIDQAGYTAGTWVPTPCCGYWLPVPVNFQAPTRMMILGSSATISDQGNCNGPYPLHVCVPDAPGGGGRLYQPLVTSGSSEPEFVWQDITTGSANGKVCGDVQEGSQRLLNALGYNGYLGIVVRLDPVPPIPALAPWALALLALLIAMCGAAVAWGR
jgi:hypothetical protein